MSPTEQVFDATRVHTLGDARLPGAPSSALMAEKEPTTKSTPGGADTPSPGPRRTEGTDRLVSTVAVPTCAPLVNIVPNRGTQKLARALIQRTPQQGADAAAFAYRNCPPDQLPALVFLLARAAANVAGLPTEVQLPADVIATDRRLPAWTPNSFTFPQRREAHRRYRLGDRTAAVVAGEREYQRNRRKPRPEPTGRGA